MTKDASTAGSVSNEGWGRLRFAVALEGATLIALVLIASPLKHFGDMPIATKIMGPVHGLAFLFLLFVLVEALEARRIGARVALRLFIGAMIPFGGVVNERWLAREVRRSEVVA